MLKGQEFADQLTAILDDHPPVWFKHQQPDYQERDWPVREERAR